MTVTINGTDGVSAVAPNAVGAGDIQSAAVSQANLAAGVAGNGPAFSAYLSAAQTISAATLTKVACNTKEWDTASCYDNVTNYRFTPNVAGYYSIGFSGRADGTSALSRAIFYIYKNGSIYRRLIDQFPPTGNTSEWYNGNTKVYMNGSTDYVELYVYITGTGTLSTGTTDSSTTYFQGVLVRAA